MQTLPGTGALSAIYLRAAPLVMLSLADYVDISNGIESKSICIVQMFFLSSKKERRVLKYKGSLKSGRPLPCFRGMVFIAHSQNGMTP